MSVNGYMRSFLDCIKSRIFIVFIYSWPAFVTLLIASKSSPKLPEILALPVAVSFVAFAVYFYNDLTDLSDDLKSKEFGNPVPASRPLGSGKISKKRLATFSMISAIIGILAALIINIQVLTLQLAYIVLGVLYSTEPIKLKKRFLSKQLTIAAGAGIATYSGALAGEAVTPATLYMVVLNILLNFSGPSLADIRDIIGDRLAGAKTLPVVLGPRFTVRFVISMFIAVAFSSFVGYLRLGFNIALPILITIMMSTWIFSIYPLISKWQDPSFINRVVFKRIVPMNVLLQLVPLIGILRL